MFKGREQFLSCISVTLWKCGWVSLLRALCLKQRLGRRSHSSCSVVKVQHIHRPALLLLSQCLSFEGWFLAAWWRNAKRPSIFGHVTLEYEFYRINTLANDTRPETIWNYESVFVAFAFFFLGESVVCHVRAWHRCPKRHEDYICRLVTSVSVDWFCAWCRLSNILHPRCP